MVILGEGLSRVDISFGLVGMMFAGICHRLVHSSVERGKVDDRTLGWNFDRYCEV